MVSYCFTVTMIYDNKSYTTGIYFPLKWHYIFQLSSRVEYVSQISSLFCCWLLFGGVYWTEKLKSEKQGMLAVWQVYLSSMNHTQTREPVSASSCLTAGSYTAEEQYPFLNPICLKSADVVVLVPQELTLCSSRS